MTCNTSSCNKKILNRIEKSRQAGGFTRAKLCRDLQHRAGTLWYVAAPQVIPEDVTEAKTPYGTYPVLHLHLKECEDGTLTDQVDWEGVKAGTYLEDKAFLLVTVDELRYNEDKTDSWVQMEITDKESRAPVSRLINTGIVTVKPLATMEAQWEWRDGQVRRVLYHDGDTLTLEINLPVEDYTLTLEDRIAQLEARLAMLTGD